MTNGLKTILVRDWNKMEIVLEPSNDKGGNGRVKKDEYGNLWEWAQGGKRIKAKRYIMK